MTISKIKCVILLFFLLSIVLSCKKEDPNALRQDIKDSQDDLTSLIEQCTESLRGTNNLALFLEEQRLWESYFYRHHETLFPMKINKVHMVWGQSIYEDMADEGVTLRLNRIQVLERFINVKKKNAVSISGLDISADLEKSELRISRLENEIKINLKNSTVLPLFLKEMETWEKYVAAHSKTVSSGAFINANQIEAEQLLLNDEHIKMLNEYILRDGDGSNGNGSFLEIVDEQKEIFGEEK